MNGFRQDLKDLLEPQQIDYIGSQTSGTMEDKQHEGYPGFTIKAVTEKIDGAIAQHPDIVLIHVGTNDCNLDPPPEPFEEAPQRLSNLVDKIAAANPKAVILLSQLIASTTPRTQENIDILNAAIPDISKNQRSQGKRVLTVDMRSVTTDYLVDELHPNEEGFAIMAQKWKEAIHKAKKLGWIH